MVIFGLVLLALGAVLVVLGLFTSEVKFEDNQATVEIANVNLSTEGLFLAGVTAAALIFIGLWALKLGAKMGWKHRKEQKRLNELSEKLDGPRPPVAAMRATTAFLTSRRASRAGRGPRHLPVPPGRPPPGRGAGRANAARAPRPRP